MEESTVESERDRHDVAGNGSGDADLEQQLPVLALPEFGRSRSPVRMDRIAEPVERDRDIGELRLRRIPQHAGAGARQVEPHLDRTFHPRRDFLDEPHARRAVNSLEVEIGRQEPAGKRRACARDERGVVQFFVAAPRHMSREPIARRARQRVVAREPVLREYGIDRLATGAAEFRIGRGRLAAERHRKAAVRAARGG